MNEAAPISTDTVPAKLEAGTSLWSDSWHRLRKNRLSIICLCLLGLVTLLCVVGPIVSPYRESDQDLNLGSIGPSPEHWFGTDTKGRDLLTRILTGGRISLAVGLAATAVSLIIGVLYGATSGYLSGKVDAFMMRTVDALYALPFLIFVILLKVILDPVLTTPTLKLLVLFVAIGAIEWLTMARIVRGQVMSLRKMEFIEAAQSLGISEGRIILRHIVPNTLGPVIVYATLTVPAVMLTEATLSFLGLGVEPPASSWGLMIKEGAENMENSPWMLFFPALFFSGTLFSLNFIGDGLRDALDVRSAKD